MDDAEVQQWLRGHFNPMPSDGPVAKTHEVCGYTRGTSVSTRRLASGVFPMQ